MRLATASCSHRPRAAAAFSHMAWHGMAHRCCGLIRLHLTSKSTAELRRVSPGESKAPKDPLVKRRCSECRSETPKSHAICSHR